MAVVQRAQGRDPLGGGGLLIPVSTPCAAGWRRAATRSYTWPTSATPFRRHGVRREARRPGRASASIATGLRFIHPPHPRKIVELTCPLPEEFTRMLAKLEKKSNKKKAARAGGLLYHSSILLLRLDQAAAAVVAVVTTGRCSFSIAEHIEQGC